MKGLKVWIINHYAIPPALAGGTRHYEFAANLAARGHIVTLWMSAFYHTGRFFVDAQMQSEIRRESPPNLDLKWVPSVPYKANGLLRILNLLSFALVFFIQGLFRGKPEVILASTPHLFAALAGWALSFVKRVPFVLEVRDLWPESLAAMGHMREGPTFRILTFLEEFLYCRALQIVVLTEGIGRRLLERGIPKDKVVFLPNGVELKSFVVKTPRKEMRRKLGFEHRFVIMYAGAHGEANGLDTIIKSAAIHVNNPEFLFVLVGEGPEKAKLKALTEKFELTNVRFLDPVPKEAMPDLLSAADVMAATLRKTDLFKDARPNKLFDYMAAGKPIICSIDGEARLLIEKTGTGIYTEPDNPQALACGILQLYNSREEFPLFAERGMEYIRNNCDREKLVLDLEKILCRVTA